jgi:uroporphyrinogen decarboxylase
LAGPLLDILKSRDVNRRPMWFMRQAGRYLPEYRALRAEAGSFLELCYNPDKACEVTLQPLRRFDLDAAILFSDILVVPHAMGLRLRFVEGEGPQLETVADLAAVNALNDGASNFQYGRVCETVSAVRAGLAKDQTLIGFCGAPWTVATYMIEGRSSKRDQAVLIAGSNPVWFSRLLERLVDESVIYLGMQIDAGAEVVQIFDSWAGDLSGEVLQRCVFAPIADICQRLSVSHPGVPVIVFGRGVGNAQGPLARITRCAALGVESDFSIGDLLRDVDEGVVLQGNLDPQILLAPWEECRLAVLRILEEMPMQRHIFNLGHGIVPQTMPERIGAVVDLVRQFDLGEV